jgi:hypothetical protein
MTEDWSMTPEKILLAVEALVLGETPAGYNRLGPRVRLPDSE